MTILDAGYWINDLIQYPVSLNLDRALSKYLFCHCHCHFIIHRRRKESCVHRFYYCITLFLCALLLTGALAAENWPGWRGPGNDGISTAGNLPLEWDRTRNVKWRLPLPGPAPSTPAVWGERIFLTSAEDDDLVLICVNTAGETLWQRRLDNGNQDIRQGESNAAAPSPATDGRHVWTFTGTGMLACHDVDGKEIWKSDLQKVYGRFNMYWGMSTTPLLDGDRLYLQLLHSDAQWVLALDKSSGQEIWRHRRKTDARSESLHSYASPVIYRHGGLELLLIHGADYITAHRLNDGSEIWRSGGLQKVGHYNDFLRFVATPVVSPGLIVVPSAKNGPVLGINPQGAAGDITGKSAFFHWQRPDNTTDVPSPLILDGLVYICRENGVLICLDALSGEEIYQERVYNRRHRGSPVYADGKIFLTAMDGTISLVKPGRQFQLLAQNALEERMAASPAIAGNTIYLRTHEALYAIG
ncbi:MAG: PQQ-binding-like beta-propeller repeat protein, partial [Calditrichaeota bacterium]|nr:PQQ-binding-like beta-propeller repeat protein [Calditrichota bacterium]